MLIKDLKIRLTPNADQNAVTRVGNAPRSHRQLQSYPVVQANTIYKGNSINNTPKFGVFEKFMKTLKMAKISNFKTD